MKKREKKIVLCSPAYGDDLEWAGNLLVPVISSKKPLWFINEALPAVGN